MFVRGISSIIRRNNFKNLNRISSMNYCSNYKFDDLKNDPKFVKYINSQINENIEKELEKNIKLKNKNSFDFKINNDVVKVIGFGSGVLISLIDPFFGFVTIVTVVLCI